MLGVSASVGDPEGTRTVIAIVALLIVLGVGLLMLLIWLFRVTRPDPELLAPLEVMGDRKWRRADPVWQRRRLDAVRPNDAEPLQPTAAPPAFDHAFDAGSTVSGFDDLQDDHVAPQAVETAVETVDDEPSAEPDADAHDQSHEGEAVPAAPIAVAAPVQQRLPLDTPDVVAPTPISIARPDELPEGDLDPEVMAAALAELDAELAGRQPGSDSTSE